MPPLVLLARARRWYDARACAFHDVAFFLSFRWTAWKGTAAWTCLTQRRLAAGVGEADEAALGGVVVVMVATEAETAGVGVGVVVALHCPC
mgnify:CR=1 FL=1